MKGSVIYEDSEWYQSLKEQNQVLIDLIYKYVKRMDRNTDGCPLRVVFEFEREDIENLKKICNINYWKLPVKSKRNKIFKNHTNSITFED